MAGVSSISYFGTLLRVMHEQAPILLVDDDYNDCTLIRRALVGAKVLNPVIVARSGEEALDYLIGMGEYANRTEFPLPALILLDVKMSEMDGLDVLLWIRHRPELRSTRVVMLGSSNDIKEINLTQQLGANSFLTKPVDFEKFLEIARAFGGYWLRLDKPPEVSRPSLFDLNNPETNWPRL